MILGELTRFPGSSIPKEALTGNPILDSFLSKLDWQLLGSAKVRLQTLAEIKDHLQEKKEHLLETGCTEDDAAEKAVQSMASPEEQAKSQREALKKKFARIGFSSGILFGLIMGLLGLVMKDLMDKGLAVIGLYGLAQGVFFGLFFGWFMTFNWPERQLPSASEADESPEVEGEFTVRYSKSMRRLSYFMTVFFVLMGVYYATLGIMGSFYPSIGKSLPFPWWNNLILGGFALLDFFFIRLACRKYKVNGDGILVEDFLGKKKHFVWKHLKKVGLLGDIRSWVPYYWKKVKYAEFQSDGHKTIRLFLYPDMVNADKLFILLEKKVRSK